ncbi:hypothetical protein [Rhodovulum sp. PH10]|uniref:hypothetical protein n=1 Tax=Rhodovulum sp. PH10 TaxID=1187851 RepID=UPI00058BAA8D|nr:hypothetical protein [Rhodovulum sp. PH10]
MFEAERSVATAGVCATSRDLPIRHCKFAASGFRTADRGRPSNVQEYPMSEAQVHAIVHFATALTMLLGALVLFVSAKKSAKRAMRILSAGGSSAEDDYVVMRGTLAFFVSGAFFVALFVWGLARLLDVEQWMNLIGTR